MLPDTFFPLVALFTVFGLIFLFRALIRPSERMRTVPIVWRVLPLAIMLAALLAGLLSSLYPRNWDRYIVLAALLLVGLAALWGAHVERALAGRDRSKDAVRLFDGNSP
jgi:uncharacterized protein YjeT (DUF2065 family)